MPNLKPRGGSPGILAAGILGASRALLQSSGSEHCQGQPKAPWKGLWGFAEDPSPGKGWGWDSRKRLILPSLVEFAAVPRDWQGREAAERSWMWKKVSLGACGTRERGGKDEKNLQGHRDPPTLLPRSVHWWLGTGMELGMPRERPHLHTSPGTLVSCTSPQPFVNGKLFKVLWFSC